MQIEATAAGDEEAHLILCVAVLCEELRASGAGLVTPAGVVVVGLQRGDVDVLVAAIAIECVDAVSVFGQDLGGRPAYVEAGLDRPTVENDVPVGEFSADQSRVDGPQPYLSGIAFGHQLQQCHFGFLPATTMASSDLAAASQRRQLAHRLQALRAVTGLGKVGAPGRNPVAGD